MDATHDKPTPRQAAASYSNRAPQRSQSNHLRTWLRLQRVNAVRHVTGLRPFRREEFGNGSAAPSEAHVQAANELISALRTRLQEQTRRLSERITRAAREPHIGHLQRALITKERAHRMVMRVEQVWDFYFELFGQRQSGFGDWLLSCDRIALDCYQTAYLGLGTARSIPAPPPFSYMRTGFSPATYRRGIPLRRLGLNSNPFPLIQLPYHRLLNPWTLGAVLHEVSHNLQNDLGLAAAVPQRIVDNLVAAGMPRSVAVTWRRWNRETFADLSGLLLGGPAIVGSLMDVVGRSPTSTLRYSARGPHPTPYLRTFLSIELLRRMGFASEAEGYCRAWKSNYPSARQSNIPRPLLATFPEACAVVVETVCYQPFPSLGNKSLAQVLRFGPKEQEMIEEAAGRLASGNDPGVVPERFLIGASRVAVERQLARPEIITTNFFRELARR